MPLPPTAHAEKVFGVCEDLLVAAAVPVLPGVRDSAVAAEGLVTVGVGVGALAAREATAMGRR